MPKALSYTQTYYYAKIGTDWTEVTYFRHPTLSNLEKRGLIEVRGGKGLGLSPYSHSFFARRIPA